jgi:hypothetical protein
MSGVTGNAVKLLNSSLMPAPVKICCQEHIQRGYRLIDRCDSGTKARNVRVVVLPRDKRICLVTNDRPSRARHAIDRHANALPAATHHDTSLCVTTGNSACHLKTKTGIINSLFRSCANVDHLIPLAS